MIAKVLSTKNKNSAIVEVERVVKHPLYKKRLRKKKRYLAQDDVGAKDGDKVSIESIRPMSKKKRFKISEVLK